MRINNYLASCGLFSRRQAEKVILSGLIKVNGEININLATKITEHDEVKFKENILKLPKTKLWIYNKPAGLVVSHADEKGRETIFDYLKKKLQLKHLISVGRLDLNSEGLILITNSGILAKKFETKGIIRRYYVRIYGQNLIEQIKIIKQKVINGIEIDGIQYNKIIINFLNSQNLPDNYTFSSSNFTLSDQMNKDFGLKKAAQMQTTYPMTAQVTPTARTMQVEQEMYLKKNATYLTKTPAINKINYSDMININSTKNPKNLWVCVDLFEGKNREIRKIFNHFNISVNRLLRFQYGDYFLNDLKINQIVEVPILD